MRIDAYNAINQVYQTTAQAKKTTTEKKQSSDKVEISQKGKDIATAKKAVSEASDIRTDKVDAIKQKIQDGTYDVSVEAVADKMVNDFFNGIS